MASLEVKLPESVRRWIDQRTDHGGYDSASHYVLDLIRKDQERQEAISEVQAEITKGVESGLSEPVEMERFLRTLRYGNGG